MLLNTLKPRLPLLTNNRNYRWVWASTIFTSFEEVLSFTALPLYVLNLTGSGSVLALMWVAQTLPALLVGPAASILVDRFNRKLIWLAVSCVMIVAYTLYASTQHIEQLFVLIAIVSMGVTTGRNAFLALMPDIVDEGQLVDANALLSMNFNVSLTIAPLIAGALIAASGAHIAFYLLALMRFTALLCMRRIRYTHNVHHEHTQIHTSRSWHADLNAGLQYARNHADVRVLLLTALGTNLGIGGLIILEALLIKQVLNAGDTGYGLMLSFAGVGAILGSLLIKPTTAHWPILRVFSAVVLLTGLTFFPYANILWFPITLVIALFQTTTFVMGNVLSETIIQRSVPQALRGRVLGLLLLIRSGMTLIAMGILGPLVDSVGTVPLLNIAGIIYTLTGIYAIIALRRATAQMTVPIASPAIVE